MKKKDVQVGKTYAAKISDRVVSVTILSEYFLPHTGSRSGWIARNEATGRQVRIKSAAKLRNEVRTITYSQGLAASNPSTHFNTDDLEKALSEKKGRDVSLSPLRKRAGSEEDETHEEEMSHRFTLTIRTDNAAFDDPAELPRLLREIAQVILAGRDITMFQTILDSNGNDVGRYALKPESYFERS